MRYWRGKVACRILFHDGKKALIQYLGFGKVGTNKLGFKSVMPGMKDITLIRHCWRYKK